MTDLLRRSILPARVAVRFAVVYWPDLQSQFLVKVRARTRLAVSRAGSRLPPTARVAPADTDGSVTFQRLVHGRWVSAGSAKLDDGVAGVKARTATKVRARFTGGSMNAASDWVTVAVR